MLFRLRLVIVSIGSLTFASFVAADAASSRALPAVIDRAPTIEIRMRPSEAAPPAYAIRDR